MARKVRYSVVIPARDEVEVLEESHRRISAVLRSTGEPYELIFVDDGSSDGTLLTLKRLARKDRAVRVVSLSRSFGHQAALSAGMDHAAGDAVVTMDADLQDPPAVIPEMIAAWKRGAEVVHARRARRKGERAGKRAAAFVFSRLLRRLAEVPIPVDVADFRLMDRLVCDWLRRMPERHRYLRGLASWVGFRQAEVRYVREPRYAGRPKYRLRASVRLAFDALTSFSTAPIRAAGPAGLVAVAAGLAYLVVTLVRSRWLPVKEGWAVAASVLIVLNGMVLLTLGMLGQYVGRLFQEAERRPLYIVRELIGFGRSQPLARAFPRARAPQKT